MSFVGIQSFADMYSCTELESVARRYIYSHFLDVIQHDEFLQLTTDRFIELLKSDQLQVNTEEQVGKYLIIECSQFPLNIILVLYKAILLHRHLI